MRKCSKFIQLLVLLLPLNWLSGQIIGINITSCIDNTIYEESNDLSNGIGDFIIIGKTGPSHGYAIRRGLIMTDFDIIPSSATIISAKLVIIGASGSSQWINLHKALKPWGEGMSDAVGNELGGAMATPNDATWNQSIYTSMFWMNDGGDYNPVSSANTLVKPNKSNDFSGPTFTADVQGWVDGSIPNYGWMMIGDEYHNGTVIGLNSGDIDNGIPYINVQYILPPRQILINEVHPTDQWLELYNPGSTSVDISDWYLCNNANCDQVSSGDVVFLNGTPVIPPKGYIRVAWNDISMASGEIALMKSSSFYFSEVMEDYVQYGASHQSRSSVAVNAGLWNQENSFVSLLGPSKSIGLDSQVYSNGEDTDQSSWDIQTPTPNKQNVCNSYLNLSSPIKLGVYAAEHIDYNGTSLTGSAVGLNFGNFVEFKPNAEVSNGTILYALKRECSN